MSLVLCIAFVGCSDPKESPGDEVECRSDQAQCGSLCVNLDANPFHCGECGEACEEGKSCDSGSCVTACSEGREACDGGCVDLQTDAEHCGTCGTACEEGQHCSGGSCRDEAVETCEGEEVECASGCTDRSKDPANCGACGNACDPSESCEAGTCVEVGACKGGESVCGEVCVDTTSDAENCGDCDVVCGGGANVSEGTCETSACVLSCEDTFGNCDTDHENGCETKLVDNDEHCGECGMNCGAMPNVADAFCWETTCEVAECAAGWGDCDKSGANGCEIDTKSSIDNCGDCGIDCTQLANNAAAPACNDGVCALECAVGYGDCDGDLSNGCEFRLDTMDNCGACGNVCDEHEQCVEGGCLDYQRAEWPVPPDAPSFTIQDGMIKEAVTGLVWRQGGVGSFATVAAAAEFCESLDLGGHQDWRLPSLIEYTTLIDNTKQFPSIDEATFDFVPPFDGATYVSSTLHLPSGSSKNHWAAMFMLGMTVQTNWPAPAICVRGGTILPGVARYIYEEDGETVYASRTNLTWHRASGATMNFAAATAHCESSTVGGATDWRLPTVRELVTLSDYRRESPAIDPVVFPMTYPADYWSTSVVNGSHKLVFFLNGGALTSAGPGDERNFRCVRSGKIPPAGE